MDLSFFSNLFNTSDPASAARLRGGLIGAGQAISQPYGNFGSALVGGAQGAQQARQDYTQQQFQDLRVQQLQDTLEQDKTKRAALNNLFRMGGQTTPQPITAAPQAGIAPAAPLQTPPSALPIAPTNPQTAPQAPIAGAQQQPPAFHLPAGFESPEQFQAYAQINPEDAMKRMFPEPERGLQGFAPGTHVLDKATNKEVFAVPEKNNPNEPFNTDGTPNAAYQAWKRSEMQAQQAPQWARVALERENAGGKGLTAPMTVEASDPRNPGQRMQFLAQQDKGTGQWVTGDQSRIPLTDVMLPGGVPGGGRAAAQVGRMIGAAKDVVTGLQNVSELPITASTGMMGLLGGKQEAHGLMDATKTVLANQMTPQDVQSTKAMYVGIAKAIGTLDAGGLQTSDTFLKQIGGLLPAEGDTHMTKLLKLAELRQQADNALEAQLNGPLLSSQQKVYAKELRESLRKSIPFTPLDVLHLDKSPNPNAKISDYATSAGLGGGAKSKMLPKPKTPADAAKLAPGTHFLDGNGVERVR